MDNLVSAEKPGDTKAKLEEDVLKIKRCLRQHLGLGLEPGGRPSSLAPAKHPIAMLVTELAHRNLERKF